ncbi:Ribosomal Pentatricopeptide Repeat Protein 9 [Hibiscus trionum]|uniref:Ribosomal Pentatricopeptide Repeat Protein 9 n=1 Tax=Hibiscus trionum TaxID=183268 RepID=A0A9W7IQ69_HIBTR|nr:Ribosomal Pentatricopeptide Repeat Protein 9 [Hibiscus trionum]
MPPLTSLQLRRLLHRCLSSLSPFQSHALLSSKPHSTPTHFPKLPFLISKSFSTQNPNPQTPDPSALSLSAELLTDPSLDPLAITPRLQLHFSHVKPTPLLISQTLNLSPEAGQTVLGFNDWVLSDLDFSHTDETLSFFIDFFGRRNDFKAAHDLLVNHKSVAGPKTLKSSIDRLVRAGRATQVLGFFERMEKDYGFKRDKESLRLVVEKLRENGEKDPFRLHSEAEKVLLDMDFYGVPRNVETFNVLLDNLLEPKLYHIDPRYMKKTKAVKKKKKRETFSEKLARKRRSLKQIRLSFVKKSRGRMRSA